MYTSFSHPTNTTKTHRHCYCPKRTTDYGPVPDDQHSARRLIDDVDTLSNLERCYRLIHTHGQHRHSIELMPTNSVPGSASSLRVYVTTYLARFLKRSVFDTIKKRQTRLNHNLFDIIWPAMKKAAHERTIDEDLNAGVVVPDFDSFVVFQEFLVPLIKDIHCLDLNSEFRPHPERIEYFPATADGMEIIPLNGEQPPVGATDADNAVRQVHLNIDPSGKWARDCVVEVVRCLDGYELPLNLHTGQLEEVELRITACIMTAEFAQALGDSETGQYYSMNEILESQSEMRTVLAAHRLLVPLLDVTDRQQLAESAAINGSRWPYGRGVFVSHDCTLAVWINVQEHMRVLTCTDTGKGTDIGVAHSRVGRAMMYLADKLHFRQSYFLGYLASRPSFLGTAMRISVTLDLPHLAKETENLRHLCTVRGLHMQSQEAATTPRSIRVSNMQSIGMSEWSIFREFCTATRNIIALERDLSQSNSKQIAVLLASVFRRKKNSLPDV